MTTPTSGAISIGGLRTEFDISGTTGSRSLSGFYDNASHDYDDNDVSNTNIPASGQVSLSNFYNTRNTYYSTGTTDFYFRNYTPSETDDTVVYWNNVSVYNNIGTYSSVSAGGYTYYRMNLKVDNGPTDRWYSVRR